jgi:hypothetical protein
VPKTATALTQRGGDWEGQRWIERETQAAVAVASALAVAAIAVGVGHLVARLRERRRSHVISNQLLSQVFPKGIR